jgi:hypothetical protein
MNRNLGVTRQVWTDANGYYRALGLPLGRYEMRAECDEFSPEILTGVMLTVAQEPLVNFQLQLRSLSQQVVVKNDPAKVDTGSSTLSSLMGQKEIRDLPLNGRDLGQLVLLQPGVVWSRASVQSATNGRGIRFSVAGARPSENLFVWDGTIINDALNNTPGSAQGLLVGVDTTEEFRVLTNTYGAEYGRAMGGVFVAVTKSGTNQLHGSIFEFLRNDALDARNFFDQGRLRFGRNQFGITMGGPIARNKTFLFGGYEGLREFKGITRVSLVPDNNVRLGVLPGQALVPVDPRSQPILNLYPKANGRSFGDGTAEFIGVTNRTAHDDFFTVRLDHTFSSSDSMFIRYLFDDSDQVLPQNFPEFPNLALNRKQVLTLEERRIISPTVVNEFRFGFSRSMPSELVSENTRSLQLIAGRPLGTITVSGLADVGTDSSTPKSFVQNDFQVGDDLFVVRGKHYLKLGGLFERFQENGDSESRTRGQLRFSSLSDLLLFKPKDFLGASADSDFVRGYRQWLLGLYFQDDLKLSARLTVNLGVRYESATTLTEVNGKVANLRDTLDPQVTRGNPYFLPPRWNFAPRLGFAYDVSGDGKTAVRGGFGVFYEPPLFNLFRTAAFRSLPFSDRGILQGSAISSLPVEPALLQGAEKTTDNIQFRLRPTYIMQYNLNVQRQVAQGMVLALTYVGSRGVNLFGVGDVNTAVPQILPDGREFFPAGSKRRNPNFSEIRRVFQGFNSYYHALNAGLIKRFGRRLQFQTSYTFGKSIDDVPGFGSLTWSNGQGFTLDPYDKRLDRARSNFDIRHTFVANASYELPFGSNLRGWAGQLVAGWQIHTVISLSSGAPFTPIVSGDPDRDATSANTARPNLVPGVSFTPPGGSTPDRWLNPTAFAPPEIGFRGTAGRNILTGPSFQSLDFSLLKNFRISENRGVQFRVEAFNLFNHSNFALPRNSPDGEQVFNFIPASGSTPARFEPSASVGRIFSTAGDSREIQMGLKFIF